MISVIMPLYNAERFLEESLKSVLEQTYRDIELICIDDGSSDRTSEIVSNAAIEDDRIVLLKNKNNRGAAYSRNKGLEIAKGDYLSFLDGDDFFDLNMFELSYKCAIENDLDIVVFGYAHVESDRIHEKQSFNKTELYMKRHCSKPFDVSDVSRGDFVCWNNAPWNKLFKREFIASLALRFQNLSSQNDVYFVDKAFLMAEKIMFLDEKKVMVYARDHDSPDRITNNKNAINKYLAYKQLLEDLTLDTDNEWRYEYAHYKCYYSLIDAYKSKNGRKLFDYLNDYERNSLNRYDELISNSHSLEPTPRLSELIQKPYESHWFNYESLLSQSLSNMGNAIWNELSKYDEIIVWGVGKNGKTFLTRAEEKGFVVRVVLDADADTAAEKNGYSIESPRNLSFRGNCLLVVTMSNITDEIISECRKSNMPFVFLVDYL